MHFSQIGITVTIHLPFRECRPLPCRYQYYNYGWYESCLLISVSPFQPIYCTFSSSRNCHKTHARHPKVQSINKLSGRLRLLWKAQFCPAWQECNSSVRIIKHRGAAAEQARADSSLRIDAKVRATRGFGGKAQHLIKHGARQAQPWQPTAVHVQCLLMSSTNTLPASPGTLFVIHMTHRLD